MLVAKKQSDKGEVGATRVSILEVGSGLPMTASPPEDPGTPWPPRTASLLAGSGSQETERPFGALLAPEGRWTFILLRVDTPRLAASSSYRLFYEGLHGLPVLTLGHKMSPDCL